MDYLSSRVTLKAQELPPGQERWRVVWDSNSDAEFDNVQSAMKAIEERNIAVWYVEQVVTYSAVFLAR